MTVDTTCDHIETEWQPLLVGYSENWDTIERQREICLNCGEDITDKYEETEL